jgi:hypothetical protein
MACALRLQQRIFTVKRNLLRNALRTSPFTILAGGLSYPMKNTFTWNSWAKSVVNMAKNVCNYSLESRNLSTQK